MTLACSALQAVCALTCKFWKSAFRDVTKFTDTSLIAVPGQAQRPQPDVCSTL